MIRTTKARS